MKPSKILSSLLKWVLIILCSLVVLTVLILYAQKINRSYWDDRVNEMCGDSVFFVIQKEVIPYDEFMRIPRMASGELDLFEFINESKKYSSELIISEIETNAINLKVVEFYHLIKNSNGEVVAYLKSYSRVSGYLPFGLREGGSYLCQSRKNASKSYTEFFEVTE